MFGANPFGWAYLGQAYAGTTSSGSVQLLTATSNGTSSVSAVVVRTRAVASSSNGTSTVTAAIHRSRAFTPSANGTSTVAASIVRVRVFGPAANGTSTVSVSLATVGTKLLSVDASNGTSTITMFFNPVWYIVFNRDLKVIEHVHQTKGQADSHLLDLASGGMNADNLSVQTLER